MGFLSDIFAYTPTGMVAEALGKAIGPTVLNTTDQAADIEALHNFMASSQPQSSEAVALKDDWIRWYAGLSWYDKNIDESVAAEAFNRRNALVRAMATNAEERAKVDAWLKDVSIRDPVTGKATNVTSSGDRVVPPKPLLNPTRVAWIVGGGLGALALLYIGVQINTIRKVLPG